ncbi:protein LOW PSII ACCUMULATION 2 chloroplastic isoform X2 [Prunus yedoensis var. nudiflora]|uniref:Protein LOW PSII ACCUMULATION 2 chloroplastic isoform X2 n=1 Tax=Prunus yedoensis var. nudiflora TaxID=2094558 RepID=A0A314UIW8_PRUYE|nr:protein LOW PSII ACCUMULATION 2 chloroplastic isoform X2 [Prunus yedoensis var. nudiflora]
MALQIQSPSSFTSKPYHHLPHTPLLHFSVRTQFTVKSQTPSEPSKPKAETTQAPPKKRTSAGLGFGSSPSPPTTQNVTSVPNKKKRVIRRSPVERPLLYSEEDEAKAKEMGTNESAFVLAWLGLGGVILAQGLLLAASGFLPEEWDKFFVKYLYPSFTPTVGLFVAGSVAYGVLKYLQNEELKVTWQKFSNRRTVVSHMSQSPVRKPHVLMVCPVTGLSRSRENPYPISSCSHLSLALFLDIIKLVLAS